MQKVVPCEVYSRVVGYFRPVHNWNEGKKQEFHDRVEFSEEKSLKSKAAVAQLVGGGNEIIDSYKIFTFPNCEKCEAVKEFLRTQPFSGEVVDLKTPEGNKMFRQYYADKSIKGKIKRTEDGTLQLPIVMMMSNGNVVDTAQSLDEAKSVLA